MTPQQQAAEDCHLVLEVRAASAFLADNNHSAAARATSAAAAHIEGHNEAFAAVVSQKRELEGELRRLRANHENTLDLLARWRELLVALRDECPNDVRLRRALAGEHPMRPAPWERAR